MSVLDELNMNECADECCRGNVQSWEYKKLIFLVTKMSSSKLNIALRSGILILQFCIKIVLSSINWSFYIQGMKFSPFFLFSCCNWTWFGVAIAIETVLIPLNYSTSIDRGQRAWSNWIRHLATNQETAGSNPVARFIFYLIWTDTNYWGMVWDWFLFSKLKELSRNTDTIGSVTCLCCGSDQSSHCILIV